MTTEIVPTTNAPALVTVAYSLDRNPAAVYLGSLSPGSRRTQRTALNTIADMVIPGSDCFTFPWGLLRYQHTAAVRTVLQDQYNPRTANRYLTAMRATIREAWRLGYMSAEDKERALDVKGIPGQRASMAEKGRHIQPGELRALMDICNDGSNAGARDAALIAIGYTCGLRRSEIAALTLADYDVDEQTLIVRHGKGNKERVVPLSASAIDVLADWLHVRGLDPGPLMQPVNRGDRVLQRGMVDHSIYEALAKRAQQAGVKAFSPHDMRRTFAGDLLDAGADIVTVQKLMGHADVTTTAGYDRRDGRAKRTAVNKLHLPYNRKWKD